MLAQRPHLLPLLGLLSSLHFAAPEIGFGRQLARPEHALSIGSPGNDRVTPTTPGWRHGMARAGLANRSGPDRRMRPIPADRWLGEDKFKHFFLSFTATGFAYAGLRTVGVPRDAALIGGAAASGSAGILKELSDRRGGRNFSFRDMTWNMLGIGAAVVLLGNAH